AWNFGFYGPTVLATTDKGVFLSDDPGGSWRQVDVTDPDVRETLKGTFVGLEVGGDTIWVGAENGLGRSVDGGKTWRIMKGAVKTVSLDRGEVVGSGGESDDVETYAYPTPFSPDRDTWVRIRYSLSQTARVTVTVYDFAGRPVRRLIEDASREGGRDHGENWDGRNGQSETVANGVYFYRIVTDREDKAFGKIVVLD
ncbi:MAG: T9SS type A sorting domain-containing protein, partial [Candidatus Latescibacteria bacterium]|nr:T9SS type A sorting domain-containing protein [Candidatus Latescibacterota bacterium]